MFNSTGFGKTFADRVAQIEDDLNPGGPGNGLKARVEALEDLHDAPEAYLGASLNASHSSYSDSDHNATRAKINNIQSAMEAHGITAAA